MTGYRTRCASSSSASSTSISTAGPCREASPGSASTAARTTAPRSPLSKSSRSFASAGLASGAPSARTKSRCMTTTTWSTAPISPLRQWTPPRTPPGRSTAASAVLRGKEEVAEFDVFLCHNWADKPAVRRSPGSSGTRPAPMAGRARTAPWISLAAGAGEHHRGHPGGGSDRRRPRGQLAGAGVHRVHAAVRQAALRRRPRAVAWCQTRRPAGLP